MVGRGEVDDDLQAETMEECAKYGQVEQVAIFEVQDPDFNEKESVRIFVRFNNQASSIKACLDMDGRFFGGRHVHACFYKSVCYVPAPFADACIMMYDLRACVITGMLPDTS